MVHQMNLKNLVFHKGSCEAAVVGDEVLNLITAGAIGDAEGSVKTEATIIYAYIVHPSKNGTLQEVVGNLTLILLFAEVTREEFS